MKNKKTMLDITENIDADIIEEAEKYKGFNKKNKYLKITSAAACICLVIALTLTFAIQNRNNHADKPAGDSTENYNNILPKDDTGVYIPAAEIPDGSVSASYDMIGLVIYKGGIYTQAQNYYADEAQKINALVGEYLGYATGNIDEWSSQDEYSQEFASSVPGKVYEVKGYDSDFRICIRSEFENENGEKTLNIEFFDRLNDINLKTGADLFESRLNIPDGISDIQYQTHEDWDNGISSYHKAEIDPLVLTEFFKQVNNAGFIYTWQPEITDNTVYDNNNQAHLSLIMNDGTVVELRLIEGGYVGYDALGWYFVQIPGDIFNTVFDLCNDKIDG